MRSRFLAAAPFVTVAALAASIVSSGDPAPTLASTPPEQDVTAPSEAGKSVTITWSGTAPPSQAGTGESTCDGRSSTEVDGHQIRLAVPAGLYQSVSVRAEFKIEWEPVASTATSDLVLTVIDTAVPADQDPQEGRRREVGSSDGGSPVETVVESNLPASTYDAQVCGFANTQPQTYTGTLTLTAESPDSPVPSVPADGLAFGAAIAADPQRDEAEPNMEIDDDGRIYTCGPTGFSQAADYAQVSVDGGAQFHLLGEPPRGQHAFGGGGDCSLATSFARNDRGFFNYATTGLGPLTNFSAARSPDGGRTIISAQTTNIPGVDRQWQTFVDADTVLLNYNQQAPRQVVVQRSDDGGVTYGTVGVAATPVQPSFPGPMKTIPPSESPTGKAIPYFPWNKDQAINLSVSFDEGRSWSMCRVAEAPGDPALFVTADHDRAGNVYVAYSEDAKFHTYMTALTRQELLGCDEPVDPQIGAESDEPTKNPGWSAPVQVDRDAIRTTVFGWIAAGGEPGRVAVAFYGTEAEGDPNTGEFRGSWDVYVNQSLDALSDQPGFSQVKATTHPFHYDSICLNGLGCDVSGGDRSLADFFAVDYNPKGRTLHVVFNQGYKRPGDAEGTLATPAVVSQIAGPSLGGGKVTAPAPEVVRNATDDPKDDAFAEFSSTAPPPGQPPPDTKVPALDFTRVEVGPERDAAGATVANGGFTVRMTLADLSDAALDAALGQVKAQELIWIFRFINGYRSAAAVARWSPVEGFSFGYNGFVAGSTECGSARGEDCLLYPGNEPVDGRADAEAGTITLTVPRAKLKALSGSTAGHERPAEVPAGDGARFYDAGAFSLANPSVPSGPQSYLYPVDNTAGMDFLLGGPTSPAATDPVKPAEPGAGGAKPKACRPSRGFTSVAVRPRRRGAHLKFSRSSRGPVDIDVFQVSVGRRIVGERRVARFRDRRRSFRWNGRANLRGRRVANGFLFVRFRVRADDRRVDTRRITLRRSRGRLRTVAGHYGRASCSVVPSFKLERPVFGGRVNRAQHAAFRLNEPAHVRFTVLRGRTVVRRFGPRRLQADVTHRFRFDAENRRSGVYRFRITAVGTETGRRVTRTLTARRL